MTLNSTVRNNHLLSTPVNHEWNRPTVFHLARHLPPREHGYPQPQPIVLDPSLRLPTDCKLLKNAMEGNGRAPVVFCGPPSVDHEMGERMFALRELGATIITLPLDDHGAYLWGLSGVCSDFRRRTDFVRGCDGFTQSEGLSIPHDRRWFHRHFFLLIEPDYIAHRPGHHHCRSRLRG